MSLQLQCPRETAQRPRHVRVIRSPRLVPSLQGAAVRGFRGDRISCLDEEPAEVDQRIADTLFVAAFEDGQRALEQRRCFRVLAGQREQAPQAIQYPAQVKVLGRERFLTNRQ